MCLNQMLKLKVSKDLVTILITLKAVITQRKRALPIIFNKPLLLLNTKTFFKHPQW